MGTFTVPLEVADAQRRRYQTVDALVDSGATYTVLPASLLERLGVVPHTARRFVLTDGSRVKRGFGRTWMRLDGREDLSPVVFGDEGAEPVLGTVTLEIFGLCINPANGRLVLVDVLMLATATTLLHCRRRQGSQLRRAAVRMSIGSHRAKGYRRARRSLGAFDKRGSTCA